MEEDLSWKPHVSNLHKKTIKRSWHNSKNEKLLKREKSYGFILHFFLFTYFIRNCRWGSVSETEIEPIQIFQINVL